MYIDKILLEFFLIASKLNAALNIILDISLT